MTPMMQQYHDAKEVCGDALLLFRMGDFYELFHDDAKLAAEIIGLTLTTRDKSENPVPMAGFPHHQLDGYLSKLIRLGHRVAICDQVEDPKLAKGLVRREVTRVVTPGTLTDDGLLDPKECNYLAALVRVARRKKGRRPGGEEVDDNAAAVGLAWVELSTGRFFAMTTDTVRIGDEVNRVAPAEILTDENEDSFCDDFPEHALVTKRPPWAFAEDTARETLAKHFGTATLEGFGFGSGSGSDSGAADGPAIRAAGAILDYLKETQKASLEHIECLLPYQTGSRLEIDQATRRSLELTRTMRDGAREGSLLAVIDRTVTAMGSRLLSDWLSSPLTEVEAINARLDAVGELVGDAGLCTDVRTELRGVYDLQRLLTRITTGRASPRDLSFIGQTLQRLPKLKARLAARQSKLLSQLESAIDLCPDIRTELETALVDECPLTSREGGIIRSGFNQRLDELRELASGGKQWIARYQAAEAKRANIPSMKVGFNKVFGYYIEITNAHREKVPDDYIRKQTLKNAERYITPELKEYEEKVLSADEQAKELEYQLFSQLRDMVQNAAGRLRATADVLARIDVLVALAELARHHYYCRPAISADNVLHIKDGRHPVLDVIEPQGTFVPNDTVAGGEAGCLLLITGPNMSGKSTYIRQVALITLLAQMGSFVPADAATIGVADRIFARVGASDELSRGQSTFMVEMTETARILNTATDRSLVILDEIGRGTSTYDGVSLAWAIVEYIHDRLGCRTLFATHYHELTDLAETLSGMANLNVDVKEWNDKIVFLHKIVPGAADKSYGIHVAQLAGVPAEVNNRAQDILAQLESQHLDEGNARPVVKPASTSRGEFQLTLFGFEEHPLLDELRQLDIDNLPPIEALARMKAWQEQLQGETAQKPR